MRKVVIADYLTAEMLREKLAQAESKEQFQRWQIIFVIKTKGFTPAEAADVVGVSKGTVHQWVHTYNRSGPEGFILKGRGGRRSSFMTVEQESELLNEFSTDAEKGLIITAWDAQKRIEKKMDMKVSDDFVYDLFNRNGWRKVVPKPRHPKSRKESQEEFKKNSPRLWMPPRKDSTRRPKRSSRPSKREEGRGAPSSPWQEDSPSKCITVRSTTPPPTAHTIV